MSKAHNVRRVEELPDDDEEAIYAITGGLHGGNPIEERIRKGIMPPRRCPPWMKASPEWTARFVEACNKHEAWTEILMELDKKTQDSVRGLLENDKLSFGDIGEDVLARIALNIASDTRRPSAQNKALELIARVKGLTSSEGTSLDEDTIGRLMNSLDERRSQAAQKGPRPLPDADAG